MFFHHLHKKIFSLALILALTIPANAAVSVSDGSAFVSKSEFATDINNLSNRMAQLENSLDAKIDSLVSSYLSRNGIWNGEKQGEDTYRVDTVISKSSYQVSSCFDDPINLFQVTKSGLLFVNYYHTTVTWQAYYSNLVEYKDSTSTPTNYGYLFPFFMYCGFIARKSADSSVTVFSDWAAALSTVSETVSAWSARNYISTGGYGIGTLSFFVEKNDYLAIQVGWVISNNYTNNRYIYPNDSTHSRNQRYATLSFTVY